MAPVCLVFTDQQTQITIWSRGSLLTIQHLVQFQGSSVHTCRLGCRFLIQKAAGLSLKLLRSPMCAGHLITEHYGHCVTVIGYCEERPFGVMT